MKWARVLIVLVTIILLAVLINAKNNWSERIEQHAMEAVVLKQESGSLVEEEQLDIQETGQIDSDAQEEPKVEKAAGNSFYNLLAAKKISKITLIGDGITAGYGHPGYTSPDEGRIIFSGNGETFREAGYDFESWANKLREYVNKPEFGTVEVRNVGIRDKTADWALRNIDGLLQAEEEAIIVMIGTDDRIFSTLEQYEAVMRELLAVADERSDFLIVMSPPPSKEDIQPYNFTMEEIDSVLTEISEERNYLFISQFSAIQHKLAEGVPYESLMQTMGANPVAGGYKAIWEEMRKELEFR